uniref:Aminopeptidase n=1 Tax=Anabas testudineus TaxID=64144 RepID=A0A7N6A7U6_ANATE
ISPFEHPRASLPRNMIENSMFEEEPDVVDLAKDSTTFPVCLYEVAYEPRSSRLLVRGLGENDMDDEEEDCESSARLLGMSFMNRSSANRSNSSPYTRQSPPRSCSRPSTRNMVVCVLFLVIVASMAMVLYFLPGCTFTKTDNNTPLEPVYPLSTNGEMFPWAQYQLPHSIRPLSYDLTLNPDLNSMTFTGRTVINMSVLHNTKRIVLHGTDLNITKATFKDRNVTVLEYKPNEQLAIKFSEELKAGQYCVLTLDYSANLSHTYGGFYNSSYYDKDGNKSVLAATQFEPLSARKAFPCFDEPSFKATFLIKISRKPDYMTLSNMPKAKSTPLTNGLMLDEFEKTSVNMSTYLVAFIVANFIPINRTVSNTLVSVYSVPEKKEHTEYALETASKLLEFYNQFFEIDYPLKKLDLVAIPDFLAGAMENWGLITFRETSLLVGKQSSSLEKQVVAYIIAHELAHQWFGNLVTMSWWNDLWLNEGFATYMEYMSLQAVLPELDIGNLFLTTRFRALDKDALNSSHPLSTEVNTREQVEEMFDVISYQKGASILLMLNASLPGDQQFRKGIIQYLKQFSGLNTDTSDLWNSLTQVCVPYCVFVIFIEYLSLFLLCQMVSFCMCVFSATLKLPESVKWLKLNYRNTGFYIVHYEDEGWAALTEALSSNISVLTHEDRASLIHNIFALSRLERVSFRQVLNLLNYMSNETETAPVTEALLQLKNIYRLLDKRQEQELVARMESYILNIFGSLMSKQTWEEEKNVSKQELRSTLLEMACSLNQENCTQKARSLFKHYAEPAGTFRIPGDLQQVVFNVAAQSDEDWMTLLNMYANATYDSEKRKILQGLASSQNAQILKEALKGDIIPTQELPLIISTVSNGFTGYLFAWDFIQQNWFRLIEKFSVGSFAIQTIIKSATSQFSTQTHLDQVQRFFSSLKEHGSQMRSVQEALETIKLNQRWMNRNLPNLQKWL